MCNASDCSGIRPLGKGRDTKLHARATCNAADVLFGHSDDQAQEGNLLNDEYDRVRPWADESSWMDEAVRDDTVERCSDLEVRLELLLRLHGRLSSLDGLLFGGYQRLRPFDLLLGQYQFVAGDRAGCLCRFLEPVGCALCGSKLRLCLQALRIGGLDFGFRLSDLGLHLRSRQFGK